MPAKKRRSSTKRAATSARNRTVKQRKKSRTKAKTLLNKNKKKFKKYAQIGVLLLISGIFLAGFLGKNYLEQHLALATDPTGSSVKEELFPSFVYGVTEKVNGDMKYLTKLELVMIDTRSSREYIYDIPVDMEYDIPGKFSNEEIKKILAFGSLYDEENNGNELLLDLVLKMFGFRSDKFILADVSYEKLFDDYIRNGNYLSFADPSLIDDFSKNVDTNLSLKELYQLGGIVSVIPGDRVTDKKYISTYTKNPEILDKEIQEFTIASPLNNEKFSIAVLNGTTKEGVAGFGARVIRNLGGRIVVISNTNREIKESVIYAEEPGSETVNVIADVLGIKKVIPKQETDPAVNPDITDRSDIIVILGFDILEKL